MREESRRTFLKKAAITSAAMSSVCGASGGEEMHSEKKTAVILYRETGEWKRYYETLK